MAGAAFAGYASTHFYAFSTLCRKTRGNRAFFAVGISPGIRIIFSRNGCGFAVFALTASVPDLYLAISELALYNQYVLV